MASLSDNYSVRERIDKVQKHFMQVLMDRIDSLQDADWVLEELDNLTDQEYQNLLGDEDIEETLVRSEERRVGKEKRAKSGRDRGSEKENGGERKEGRDVTKTIA